MKHLVLVFVGGLVCFELFAPLSAVNQPNVDEIDAMLKKVESNLSVASQVTSVAKAQGDKLVESKVQEKKQLKENLEQTESQLKQVAQKVELFSTRMVEVGLDTTLAVSVPEEAKLSGVLYEEWLEYKKNGGDSDFDYYRVYKK